MSIRNAAFAAALLATAGLALSATAGAQDLAKYHGPYVSGALGINQARDADIRGTVDTEAEFNRSLAGAVALGYALGNGLRFEGELAHRRDGGDSVGGTDASGHVKANSFLVNAVYDFSTGGRITPYLGLGAGMARLSSDLSPVGGGSLGGDEDKFAWQGIAGIAVPLNDNLAFTTDVRYFDAGNPRFSISSGGSSEMEYRAWTLLVGLRWNFGAPKPAMAEPVQAPAPAPKMAEPKPAPAPAPKTVESKPAPQRSYLVFFDWNKADVRADARKVLEAAAAAVKKGDFVKITLTGHADRSGPAGYNQRLSVRRANAAKAVLVQLGVAAKNITAIGKGETQPLVPTADGVREPRNRRVEIVF